MDLHHAAGHLLFGCGERAHPPTVLDQAVQHADQAVHLLELHSQAVQIVLLPVKTVHPQMQDNLNVTQKVTLDRSKLDSLNATQKVELDRTRLKHLNLEVIEQLTHR